MTDQEWQDLGRRAVACRGWRWLPGMVDDLDTRVIEIMRDGRLKTSDTVFVQHAGTSFPEPATVDPCDMGWPNLCDAATLGCLPALLRDAWGCPVWVSLDVEPDPLDDSEVVPCEPSWWTVWRATDGDYVQPCGGGLTDAEALVAALEAAP